MTTAERPTPSPELNPIDPQQGQEDFKYPKIMVNDREQAIYDAGNDDITLPENLKANRWAHLVRTREDYAKVLAKRQDSSFAVRATKRNLRKGQAAYEEALTEYTEARVAADDDEARISPEKTREEALDVLLGFRGENGRWQGGELFKLNDAVHTQRLLQSGRFVQNEYGEVVPKDGKISNALNRIYGKWGEWSQQGKKGLLKKAGAMGLVGVGLGALGGASLGIAGGAAIGVAAARGAKTAASLKLNKEGRRTQAGEERLTRMHTLSSNAHRELEYGAKPTFPDEQNPLLRAMDHQSANKVLQQNLTGLLDKHFSKKANKVHRRNMIGTSLAAGTTALLGSTAGEFVHQHAGEFIEKGIDFIRDHSDQVVAGTAHPANIIAPGGHNIPASPMDQTPNAPKPTVPGSKIDSGTTNPRIPGEHSGVPEGKPAPEVTDTPKPGVDNGTTNPRVPGEHSGVPTNGTETPGTTPHDFNVFGDSKPKIDNGTSNARDGYSGVRTPTEPAQQQLMDEMRDKHNGLNGNGPDDNLKVGGQNHTTPTTPDTHTTTPNQPNTPSTPHTPNTGKTGLEQTSGVKTIKLDNLDKSVPAKIYTTELGPQGYQQMLQDAKSAMGAGELEQVPNGHGFYYRLTAKGAAKIGAGVNSSRTQDVMSILSSFSDKLKVSR